MALIPEIAVQSAAAAREFSLLWSVIAPGGILLFSIVATWLLYRHFAGKNGEGG